MIPVSKPCIGDRELAAIDPVLKSGWLGLGPTVFNFEEALKKYLGAKNVIAVNTGTSALHIALDAVGVGPGDEVIVPSMTFVASIQPILLLGATPVFCEVQKENLLLDIEDVRKKITPKTKAIIPVHYCGNSCDMDSLLELAKQHQFWVIEDAAHAFGSDYKGRKIGSFGHLTCFSFDPIKVITTGEGGAISLIDDVLAEEIRRKRILGIDKDTWHRYRGERTWFYEVTTTGYRYHMSSINAAIGIEQLKQIEPFITRRREICSRYDSAFSRLHAIHTLKIDWSSAAPFTYILRVPGNRDAFMKALAEQGIGTGVHYIPNHTQPLFEKYAIGHPLPITTLLGEEIVTIPLYVGLTDGEVDQIIKAVCTFDSSTKEV